MRYLCLFIAPALLVAQSATSTYQADLNGRMTPGISRSKSNGDQTNRMQSVNGRMVPMEQVSERVLREDANGKVTEKLIKQFDADGRLVLTQRVMVEESPVRGGAKTIKENVSVSDISGHFTDTERRITETRVSGQTTTTNVSVDRASTNGSFAPAERRSVVITGTDDRQQKRETIERPDLNGHFREVRRTETSVDTAGQTRTENAVTYAPDATGRMSLHEQRVATTTKRPGGGETTETNIYGLDVSAQLQGAAARPRIREQQILDRQVGADGTVRESLTVRLSGSDPNRLGAPKKLSETVCTGKCLPDEPPPAAAPVPAPAAAKPAATSATGKRN